MHGIRTEAMLGKTYIFSSWIWRLRDTLGFSQILMVMRISLDWTPYKHNYSQIAWICYPWRIAWQCYLSYSDIEIDTKPNCRQQLHYTERGQFFLVCLLFAKSKWLVIIVAAWRTMYYVLLQEIHKSTSTTSYGCLAQSNECRLFHTIAFSYFLSIFV